MPKLQALNNAFAIDGQIRFQYGAGGLPVAVVENTLARATIALQGAHLLDYQRHGEEPLIWVSDDATFATGRAIRGGIPVCWPWFGAHPDNPDLPNHGPVRTMPWHPVATTTHKDGSSAITLSLRDSVVEQACRHPLSVQLQIRVGSTLSLTLETSNRGNRPFLLGNALHSYFRVGDVRQLHIDGLQGCDYLDKVDGFARKRQSGTLTIASETDRIYLQTQSPCTIVDPVMRRSIIIHSRGSTSTVVWNPWQQQAEKMGDLGLEGYLHMLCVETANAANDMITLPPGGSHRLMASYTTEEL